MIHDTIPYSSTLSNPIQQNEIQNIAIQYNMIAIQ